MLKASGLYGTEVVPPRGRPCRRSCSRSWDARPSDRTGGRRGRPSVRFGGRLLALVGDLACLGHEDLDDLVLGDLVLDLAVHDEAARSPCRPRCRGRPRAPRRGRSRRSPSRRRGSAPSGPRCSSALVHLLGQSEHVDLGPAARRAGHEVEPALAQAERLQDPGPDLDLLDGVVGQRDADRVADALGQQRADPDRATSRRPPASGPASVTPRCSG